MSKGWINLYRHHGPGQAGGLCGDGLACHYRRGRHILARGMPDTVHEAAQNTRTVVIEFESLAAAKAAYQSPGYQEALPYWVTGLCAISG